MYVFHSWKPINSAEETADFLIITRKMVASFEVKAFELVEQPATENIETFNKVIMKSLEQQAKVRLDLGNFLRDHGCGIQDNSELSLATFTLFPIAKSRAHHLSNISNDLEVKLSGNNRIDWVTASNFRERILFCDEYLAKLQEITKQESSVSEQEEFQLRTLLSWLYGTYSYQGIRRPDKLELIDSYKLDKELNIAHIKINRDIEGVFLTEAQIEVLKCDQDFLAIVGYPGTGKTYCLVAKLLDIVKEKMMPSQALVEAEDDLIVVIHAKESTLKRIKEIIWSSLSRLYKGEDVQKVGGFLKFYFLEQDAFRDLRENGKRLKIFFDDYQNNFWCQYRIYELMKYVTFFWYTCYSIVPWSDWLPRPFSELSIDGELIYEANKYALLNKTVRFSAEIFKMVKVLTETMKTSNAHAISNFGPRMTGFLDYECGTRVVGDQIAFVSMDYDFRVLRNTLQEIENQKERFEEVKTFLTKTVLGEVLRLNQSFSLEDIWILDLGGWAGKALKQGLCEAGSEAEVIHYTEIRGLEKQCVVMINDLTISYDSAILLDAITRAISKVVILYSKDDLDFHEIAKEVQGRTPEICTSAIRKKNKTNTKSTMNTMKDYEQCRLYDLLVGEGWYQERFWRFANTLHSVRSPCSPIEKDRSGVIAYCCLSCAEESLKAIKIVSDSQIYQQFQTACHYALVLEEINHCCYNLQDKTVNEKPMENIEYVEAVYERIISCLYTLVSWMRKIEEETEITPSVFPSSFFQYKRVFQKFRSYKKQLSWTWKLDTPDREIIYRLMAEIDALDRKYTKAEGTAGLCG